MGYNLGYVGFISYNPLILTIDPNFLGHPSGPRKNRCTAGPPASPWRSIPTTYRVEELPRSASRSGFPKKNLGFPKKMGERIWCFWFLMVFPGILVGLFLANFFLEEGGREGKSIVKCKDFGVGKWNLWGIHWYMIQKSHNWIMVNIDNSLRTRNFGYRFTIPHPKCRAPGGLGFPFLIQRKHPRPLHKTPPTPIIKQLYMGYLGKHLALI